MGAVVVVGSVSGPIIWPFNGHYTAGFMVSFGFLQMFIQTDKNFKFLIQGSRFSSPQTRFCVFVGYVFL